MKRSNYSISNNLIILAFSLCLLFSSGCSLISVSLISEVVPLKETTLTGDGKDKVLIVDISGIITEEDRRSIIGIQGEPDIVSRIKEELKLAAQDEHVKAVVLRINSPGGAVTASDVIYHEIKQYKKETGVKIVACIMDLGASGGYYVAVAADKIVAHPTTITGSIGVIMLNISLEGLLQKVGIKDASIKTGEHKDMGSPLRTMTDEERQIFQGVMSNMHERFLGVITENRKELPIEKLRTLADGRIYTAQQALENKLIDQIGYLNEAIDLAKKESGLPQSARVVTYHRPGAYKNNIYSQLSSSYPSTINLLNFDLKTFVRAGTPSFMYLWSP